MCSWDGNRTRNTRQTTITRNDLVINASQDAVFRAFTNPDGLVTWLAPRDMAGTIRDFDLRVGGGYTMSLTYRMDDARGKTTEREDRYTARYLEIVPPDRIVLAIESDTEDPAFDGVMTMTVTLEAKDGGTEVGRHPTLHPP